MQPDHTCCPCVDRLRAAGGVQPAPAARAWTEPEIRDAYEHGSIAGTCDDVDNVISALHYLFDPDFHTFDGGSTDGAGTPGEGYAKHLATESGDEKTDITAGGAGGTTPTGEVCACEHPAAVDGRDCMDCGKRVNLTGRCGGVGCPCPGFDCLHNRESTECIEGP